MSPIPQQAAEDREVLDFHMTPPGYLDLGHPGILSGFNAFCALFNLGADLSIIQKKYEDGNFVGLQENTVPLPAQVNGMWCRLFNRGYDLHVLVLDYDRRDFVIYNIALSEWVGRWFLEHELPEGAHLDRVETLPWEEDFRLFYTHDGVVHSIMRSFNAPQWGSLQPHQ